jgi:hypothetical protein
MIMLFHTTATEKPRSKHSTNTTLAPAEKQKKSRKQKRKAKDNKEERKEGCVVPANQITTSRL